MTCYGDECSITWLQGDDLPSPQNGLRYADRDSPSKACSAIVKHATPTLSAWFAREGVHMPEKGLPLILRWPKMAAAYDFARPSRYGQTSGTQQE